MTYGILTNTIGFQPSITIDEWYAMNADGQLEWLAREVGRREKRWKDMLTRSIVESTASNKAALDATGTRGPSPLSIVAVAIAGISFLLSLGMWAVSR